MTSIFDAGEAEQRARGAYWTTREILQQPRIWREAAQQLARERDALRAFLAPLMERHVRIVLTGAGTSAYVGECLAPALRASGQRVELVPTTDLIASPSAWLERDVPTLLVSFARSGNSPESVAAIEVADRWLPECWHLAITCNAEGALNQRTGEHPRGRTLLLPAEANDRSFAMTSSFTGMLLVAALTFGLLDPAGIEPLATAAEPLLGASRGRLAQLVATDFRRAVFLGSGVLKGLAHEAALKLLELTDGRIVSLGETPLGFRHGPKTFLDSGTLVMLFLSSDPHTRRYEQDLLAELRREGIAGEVVAVGEHDAIGAAGDLALPALPELPGAGRNLADLIAALPMAMLAQSLALLRSVSLGFTPDQPNAAGTVSRVVQGVTVYPFEPGR